MRIISFDLEIANEIPPAPEDDPYSTDWRDYRPLGITCAAACFKTARNEYIYKEWQGVPQMTMDECREMVNDLQGYQQRGFTIASFNGLGFDFDVLAEESGMQEACTGLASHHVDIMFQWFCHKGWRIGLDGTCKANGVEGKLHEVTLKSGEVVTEIDGADAPRMWAEGEHEAVLTYLREDVRATLDLAHIIQKQRQIQYWSQAGKAHSIQVPGLMTVRESLAVKAPYVGWMDDATPRDYFYGWMEENNEHN